MKWINSLSMRNKLLVLVIPLLMAMLLFASQSILNNVHQLKNMQQLQSLTTLASTADPLLDVLQVERGRSAMLLASSPNSESARTALKALEHQHGITDRQLAQYSTNLATLVSNSNFDAEVSAAINESNRALQNLAQLRRGITNGSLSAQESTARYTVMIRQLFSRIPLIARGTSDPLLARQVSAYLNLAEATERAGLERAKGAILVNNGRTNLAGVREIAELTGAQAGYIDAVMAMLPQHSREWKDLDGLMSSPQMRDLEALRATLFSTSGQAGNMDATDWFSATTANVQSLQKVGLNILAFTHSAAQKHVDAARAALGIEVSIVSVILMVVLSLMLLIIRTINGQVAALLNGLQFAMNNKDLGRPLLVTSRDEIGSFGTATNSLFDVFSNALRHIDEASIQLATATEETSSTAENNAEQIRAQQLQIHQVAAATEEMSATSEEISRNTVQMANAAASVMEKSASGEQVLRSSISSIHSLALSVQEVTEVINELDARSGKISDVVHVIRQVAEQTNLLSLNAAIEAARAGEHGRGFAVVADEVRALARQTHDSTKSIEEIISGFAAITQSAGVSIEKSQKLATETSEQSQKLEQTFTDILCDVSSISDMTTQVATAAEQQVSVTRELANNMESVSEAAILTLTGSQEITQVTHEQARLARQLQDLANEFKVSAA